MVLLISEQAKIGAMIVKPIFLDSGSLRQGGGGGGGSVVHAWAWFVIVV